MEILIVAGLVIGILLGIILIYLTVVIFFPGFHVPSQPLQATETKITDPPGSRKDISFQVNGVDIKGWLYLPKEQPGPVPCIVMNTGLGGTKDMILEKYALRCQNAGVAALTFDYRHFGESDGEPRQLFVVKRQLEDCRGAIEFARGLDEIDANRIGIWGTSAGGGYGLALAAENENIKCVAAQVTGFDSGEAIKTMIQREGMGYFLRLFMHAQRDRGRGRLGLSPHTIPIVGKPGTLAVLSAPGAFNGYAKLAPPGFVNELCARSLLMSGGYNPMDFVGDIRCPVLIQVGEKDNLVPPDSAHKVTELLGERAELHEYPIGHFEIYEGEYFERSVDIQVSFFQKHL